jgi:hypothetical protein
VHIKDQRECKRSLRVDAVARVEEGEEGDGQKRADRDVEVECDGARVESLRAAKQKAVERRQQKRCCHRPAARRRHQHLLTISECSAAESVSVCYDYVYACV